ncbi:MAG: LTA synthase family protein [Eubacteriales bacterium]|nr:LTA synthase family protein [Eubacteriales bacterium]
MLLFYGAAVFISACCIFNLKKLNAVLAALSVVLMPIAGFLLFETLQGNILSIVKGKSILVIVFNVLLFAFIYLLFLLVFRKMRTGMIVGTLLIFIFGIANYFTVMFRGKAIMPQDILNFSTALSVAGKYEWKLTARFFAGTALTVALIVYWMKTTGYVSGRKIKAIYLVLLVADFVLIWTQFYRNNAAGIEVSAFSIQNSYEEYGLLPVDVMAMKKMKVQEPEGYSPEYVENLAEKYPVENTSVDLPQNVIVIMNEAWSDLSVFDNFSTDVEVSPFISSLRENTVSGHAYVSAFGGGTVDSEFEFLTGNSIYAMPLGSTPYQYYINTPDFPSLPQYFKNLGYETVAYHPFSTTNYNRLQVYNNMGFDSFYADEDFEHDLLRYFAKDESDFENLIRIFENKKSEKLFVFNVTIQNHGGYTYDNNDFPSTIHVKDHEGEFPNAEQYLTLINMTDNAFSNLIRYFSAVDEKTVILMFGDHQPSLEDDFYSVFWGDNEGEYNKKYESSYVLWANYDLDVSGMKDVSLNYLASLMLETTGFDLPGYSRFLTEMSKDYPVINMNGYIDGNGNYSNWDEKSELPESIRDYSRLQYNYMFDAAERPSNFYWSLKKQ